jgi:hypothetical protein
MYGADKTGEVARVDRNAMRNRVRDAVCRTLHDRGRAATRTNKTAKHCRRRRRERDMI